MPTWSRSESTVTRAEWRIPTNPPWGACWNEVYSVIEIATGEYRSTTGKVPSDDSIRVHTEDDAIVVSFVKEERRGSGSQQVRPGGGG